MANVEVKVEALIEKTIENLGYELYDVIFEKEAQDYYLRIFIDKKEGIDLNDCEKVNDAISDMLDEANYIKEPYFLEVSSPGIERMLRKEKHLQASIEKEIEIKLYKPIELKEAVVNSGVTETNKQEKKENRKESQKEIKNNDKNRNTKKKKEKKLTLKELSGVLKSFNETSITIEMEEGNTIEISRKDISTMKLKYNWE